MASFELDIDNGNVVKIKVIGVGGGGGNAVNRMISYGLDGVDFISINTDKQALFLNQAPLKLQIGDKLTRGKGAGADPSIGKKAAEESTDDIVNAIGDADLVFIAAGLGGGTGTGAAPVIADIAKKCGAITVAFVTLPFWFEGKMRSKTAQEGYSQLKEKVDSVVKIPNDKLLAVMGKNTPLLESFKLADDALRQGIEGLTELIKKPGLINLDFADVKTVMMERGEAHMGLGVGHGENKVEDAIKQAIQSPLLDTTIQGAKGIIVNVTADATCGLAEIQDAMRLVNEAADPEARVILGADIDLELEDEVRITVIATGFGGDYKPEEKKLAEDVKQGIETLFSKNSKPQRPAQPEKKEEAPAPAAPARSASGPMDIFIDDDEPELPVFLKKSPKRLNND